MVECLIEGCEGEAEVVATSGGRKYCACKKHRKDVSQIIASEFTRAEKERAMKALKQFGSEEKQPPKWIGF